MRLVFPLLACALLLAGCTASNSTDGQKASSGGKGNFSMAGNQGLSSSGDSRSFENDGGPVEGSYSANIGSGTMRLSITDASGQVVWSQTVGTAGQASSAFTTRSGTAGTWKASVSLTSFSGQYAFEGHST